MKETPSNEKVRAFEVRIFVRALAAQYQSVLLVLVFKMSVGRPDNN